MFELNLSNALALIDQPVWVVTEVRSRNKNGRIYAKSRAKSTVYPGNIQTVSVWRGYTRAGDSVGAPKCTVEVCIHTGDDLADNVILPAELLNVTVFDKKEDAEKELAYLNANMNTMTFSEQRQRENKKTQLYAASQQNQSPKTMPILRCLSRKSSTQRPLVPPAKRLFAESPCYRRRRPNCSVGYAIR